MVAVQGNSLPTTTKYLDGFVVPANVVKTDKGRIHFKCLVSGEAGVVSAETLFADKDGKRYYFCCDGCKKEFNKMLKNQSNQIKKNKEKLNQQINICLPLFC